MYKITSNGNPVAYVDTPNWVKVVDGVSQSCIYKEADGIIAGGTPYNLVGHNAFPDSPTAWVTEVDGGEVVFAERQRTDNNETKITEVDDTALTSLEATTDLYEQLLDKGVLD
jgi:hypothetical protein